MIHLKSATALALALSLGVGAAFISEAQAATQSGAAESTYTSTPQTTHGKARSQAQEFRARADDLIGRDVVNRKGDKVGDLNDVVADKKGHVYGVVQVGGVAGVGGKDVVVPAKKLRIGQDNVTLLSKHDADQLKKMPVYKKAEYHSLRRGVHPGTGGPTGTEATPGTGMAPATGTGPGTPGGRGPNP